MSGLTLRKWNSAQHLKYDAGRCSQGFPEPASRPIDSTREGTGGRIYRVS